MAPVDVLISICLNNLQLQNFGMFMTTKNLSSQSKVWYEKFINTDIAHFCSVVYGVFTFYWRLTCSVSWSASWPWCMPTPSTCACNRISHPPTPFFTITFLSGIVFPLALGVSVNCRFQPRCIPYEELVLDPTPTFA